MNLSSAKTHELLPRFPAFADARQVQALLGPALLKKLSLIGKEAS